MIDQSEFMFSFEKLICLSYSDMDILSFTPIQKFFAMLGMDFPRRTIIQNGYKVSLKIAVLIAFEFSVADQFMDKARQIKMGILYRGNCRRIGAATLRCRGRK
jgi:hypothetical protein